MKLLVAGEGVDELGAWANERPYRPRLDEDYDIGMVEAFALRLLSKTGPQVVDAELWRSVRKYRAGDHAGAEARTVMGLALKASEAKVDALLFLRDRDGDRERTTDIADGIERARVVFPALTVVGGIPVEELESWVLSLLGDVRAESYSDPKSRLARAHPSHSSRDGMVKVVQSANLESATAPSLRAWLDEFAKLG